VKFRLTQSSRDFLAQYSSGILDDSEDFSYVTIHPLAGETKILSPGGCVTCDAYWAITPEIVAFVSVLSDPQQVHRTVVTECRENGDVRIKFFVRTHQAPLSRHHFENALRHLSRWYRDTETIHAPMEVAGSDLCV